MLIVCPTCATTYQIQLAALGAAGRSVRCSHCKNTWFAAADSMVEEATVLSVSAAERDPALPQPPADDFAAAPAQDVIPPEHATAAPPENPFIVAHSPPLVPRDQPETDAEPEPPK